MVYLVILVLLILPLFIYKNKQNANSNNVFYWFEFTVLFLLMGLRYHVGGDTFRYEHMFYYHPTLTELLKDVREWIDTGYQPLWTIFLGTLHQFTDDFTILQIIQSFFVNFVIFYLANRYCKARYTFVVLYFCLNYLYFCSEILREAIAVCIFMLGFKYLVRKEMGKYFLVCFISFMFHVSALFLFVLPLLYPLVIKYKPKKLLYMIAITGVIIGLLSKFILVGITDVLFSSNQLLVDRSSTYSSLGGLNFFGITAELIYAVPAIVPILMYNKEQEGKNYQVEVFILGMYLLTDIIGILFTPLGRLNNYFSILFLYVFVNFISDKYYKFRNSSIMFISIFLLLFSKAVYYGQVMDSKTRFRKYQRYVPYSSIFDKTIDKEREHVIKNEWLQ